MDKIKNIFKKKGALLTALLVFVGILFIILPQGEANTEEKSEELTLEEYKLRLESELSDMCRATAGVGKCKVMVTFERGAENTYKGSLLTESKPPRVMGVSIICEGADSGNVRARLTEMICALFDIGTNRVAVLRLEN